MPHLSSDRTDAHPGGDPRADAERSSLRVTLGKVSLLLVVALTLSASVRSVEGVSESIGRGGSQARDAVRMLTSTAQQAARRLALRDQVKPLTILPDWRTPTAALAAITAPPTAGALPPASGWLRPEHLDLPPPAIA